MKKSLTSTVLLASVALNHHVDGFVVSSTSTSTARTTKTTSSALNLVPEQGKQLEAAMNAAYAREAASAKENSYEDAGNTATTVVEGEEAEEPPSRAASARAFAARVFSLPSSIIRGHPHPKMEGLEAINNQQLQEEEPSLSFEWDTSSKGDDVVLFPLVGFQFFYSEDDNKVHALPSHKNHNPSCRLRVPSQEQEEVVGWFSKACHLDPYQPNDELYGQAPATN